MANKFPTAAVYWPAIHCEPKLVTVENIINKSSENSSIAVCRVDGGCSYFHMSDLYDPDMLTFAERAHNMWKATLDLKKMMMHFRVV